MPNMSDEATSPAARRALAVAVVVAGLIAGYVVLVRNRGDETRAPNGASGFQERAQEAGIAFRMHDLPKEQGEPFHINLYDHGSGLAVDDYDNDGHEDIYFLNQLGRSEEHTSELQSPCNLVCRLLLEKKKKKSYIQYLSDRV